MRIRTVKEIGALIRDKRRARGWDQATLAERIGASRLWVSTLENGKSSVQLDLVLRALAALDLPVDIGEDPQPTGSSRSAELIRRALDEL